MSQKKESLGALCREVESFIGEHVDQIGLPLRPEMEASIDLLRRTHRAITETIPLVGDAAQRSSLEDDWEILHGPPKASSGSSRKYNMLFESTYLLLKRLNTLMSPTKEAVEVVLWLDAKGNFRGRISGVIPVSTEVLLTGSMTVRDTLFRLSRLTLKKLSALEGDLSGILKDWQRDFPELKDL